MTDLHGKRKYAGPPPAELRKIGEDAVVDIRNLPPHKQPRDYELTIVTTTTEVCKEVHKFKTKAHMEQFKVDALKRHNATKKIRRLYSWRSNSYESNIQFEEKFP